MFALLILDVQVGLVHAADPPWRCAQLLANINALMEKARRAGAPIFLARHIGPEGSPIGPGSPLTELAPELRLAGGEQVFEKRRPNAFAMTGLAERLRAAGASGVVITGMKTEYCVDSSCRAARDLGFAAVLVADAHSCTDTPQLTAAQIVAHHNATLAGPFCQLVEARDWEFAAAPG
ncbi:cysteine hydrolase family protein [Comamonas antarctica]|uniref:cysteine hydrolase family protein n=1 Tax=Comamonas antarctica TaxID=2743470 RepID=UPI0028E3DA82|nr:cysteine hydrolase family protein [Comamonas antarctica]